MIIERNRYKTRVVGYGSMLYPVRTPDGVLHIDVRDVPNCVWQLEGDSFFCAHNEFEIVEYTVDHMGFDGHYQTEPKGYECSECGEALEGSPEEDALEAIAQLNEERDYEATF